MEIWNALATLPQPASFKAESLLPSGQVTSGVYVLRDLAGTPVYVGQSCDIARRLTEHRLRGEITFHRAEWWYCNAWHERLRVEGILILALSPRHNRGLALGKRKDGRWFQIGSPDQNAELVAGPPTTRAAGAGPGAAACDLGGAGYADGGCRDGDEALVEAARETVAKRRRSYRRRG